MVERLAVLCVDDEPAILDGLMLTLRRRYEVLTAPGATAALALLEHRPDVVAIIADQRMPKMSGVSFFEQCRKIAPDASRILLTGYLDLEAAIAAVNQGQVFRLLQKPSSPAAIIQAVEAAIEHYRMVTGERVLLEQTLQGAVKVVLHLFELAHPAGFAQSARLKRIASTLCDLLEIEARWSIETATTFTPLFWLHLGAETTDKARRGLPFTDAEHSLIERGPSIVSEMFATIPGLDEVRQILDGVRRPYQSPSPFDGPAKAKPQRGASILRVAIDFDELEISGHSSRAALDIMQGRSSRYAPEVLAALQTSLGASVRREVRELALSQLKLGMTFVEDVRTGQGTVLVARGQAVTAAILERLNQYPPKTVREPILVYV